jgi:hypothetical protein
MKRSRIVGVLMGVFSLGASARGDVLVVGPPSVGGAYSTIQQAVTAAQDGDVILVHTADTAAFTIDGKSLTVANWPGRTVQIQGTITVRNVPSGGVAVLQGLSATGTSVYPKSNPGLLTQSNPGLVRVQDCTLNGGYGTGQFGCLVNGAGGNGATIETTPKLLLEGCTITGGLGYGDPVATCIGGLGGHGVQSSGSALAVYDCRVTGGEGGTSDLHPTMYGGKGGDGIHTTSWGVFVSGGRVKGGPGGSGGGNGGPGGDGMHVDSAQARILDVELLGGEGGFNYNYSSSNKGVPGVPTSGNGAFFMLPAESVALSTATVVSDEDRLVLEVSGEPEQEVWLFVSRRSDLRWQEGMSGFAAFPNGTRTTQLPIGKIPWTGTLLAEVPGLEPLGGAGPMWIQAMTRSPQGEYVFSDPRVAVVLDAATLTPDCNGNGKLDLCDILSGTSQDLDRTWVPDECESHTQWHVDDSAPGGGNGSAGSPFQNLQQAFQAAQSGDTVLVEDGYYSGPGNRDLASSNRSLILRSRNGPGTCTVDLQLLGSAMDLAGAGHIQVEGFTFRNASHSAIHATNDSLEVVSCVFQACESPFGGGGIYTKAKSTRVRASWFLGNTTIASSTGGGAIYAYAETVGTSLVIEDSIFHANSAQRGGALYCAAAAMEHCVVSRCLFLANSAATDGGGLFATVQSSVQAGMQVESCLFANNSAANGGGIAVYAEYYSGELVLRLTTLVSNQATNAGGGLNLSTKPGTNGSADVQLGDSILWGNVAASGAQINLGVAQSAIDVRYSDVQGGQAAVSVAGGATLTWGAGNLNVDPAFADPDGPDNNPATLGDNDWRLGALSPCIDAGSNPLVPQDAFDQDFDRHFAESTPFDLAGLARKFDDPTVPNTGVGKTPLVDLGAYERH